MTLRHHPLCLAIQLLLGAALGCAHAAHVEAPEGGEPTLETVVVSALALEEDPNRVASPFSLVERDSVAIQAASTIGDVLSALPGVHADTFGGGASRPVIRGQTAPRVKLLSDGAAVLDASDISPDHASTVDPLLTRRVEVLRGPATLLYGSGAVGGVVNVLDDRIPTAVPEAGMAGSVALRGNSVADELAGAAQLTLAVGNQLVLHAEGSMRDADDYRAPGTDERRVDGTFARSGNGSLGVSWLFERGHVGLAYSRRDDEYGLPGHMHEYDSCHPHGSQLHCGGHGHEEEEHQEHAHEHEHHAAPVIDLLSNRLDLRGEIAEPLAGLQRLRFRASHTDYRHHELDEDVISSTFRNNGHELRVELQHVPLGNWTGVLGVHHSDTRFSADGEEAFLPMVDTRSTALFLVEHLQLGENVHLELGARQEWLEHQTVADPRRRPDFDDAATSLSAAAVWEFSPGTALTLLAARSQRLPHAQELYARGLHLATNTYECGLLPSAFTCGGAAQDRALQTETSQNLEIGLRRSEGPLTFALSAFANDVDHYIHARTLDQFEEFRLVKYAQSDARFRGLEAQLGYAFAETYSAELFADRVRARFADGSGALPRIPAARMGTRLRADWGRVQSELEYFHVNSQDRIADFETRTPGHDMLNLSLAFTLGSEQRTRVFLRGSNLLDERVLNHASFLASAVPLPGRNVSAGMRFDF